MYPNLALFIDGQWISGGGREVQPVINPATLEPLGMLPHAGKDDLDDALQAAAIGFRRWRAMSVYDRARIMCKAADLMVVSPEFSFLQKRRSFQRPVRSQNPRTRKKKRAQLPEFQRNFKANRHFINSNKV